MIQLLIINDSLEVWGTPQNWTNFQNFELFLKYFNFFLLLHDFDLISIFIRFMLPALIFSCLVIESLMHSLIFDWSALFDSESYPIHNRGEKHGKLLSDIMKQFWLIIKYLTFQNFIMLTKFQMLVSLIWALFN